MKKQEIRRIYTEKVTELLNQGWTIFPDTMNGSQGEIAHIDLTDGCEIRRVLLERGMCWDHSMDGFYGDGGSLQSGKAPADTWLGDRWDGPIWNNRPEPSFQIRCAEVSGKGEGWYAPMEEGLRICNLQRERVRNRPDRKNYIELGEASKSAALRWVQKQPRMKTCKLSEIEGVRKVHPREGKPFYEIKARGRIFRTDNVERYWSTF